MMPLHAFLLTTRLQPQPACIASPGQGLRPDPDPAEARVTVLRCPAGLAVIQAALSSDDAPNARLPPALLPAFVALLHSSRQQLGDLSGVAEEVLLLSAPVHPSPLNAALLSKHTVIADALQACYPSAPSNSNSSNHRSAFQPPAGPMAGVVPGLAAYSFMSDSSLVNLMAELGCGASDEAAFKALLLKFPDPPSEQTVADVLLLMARTHASVKEGQPQLQAALWVALGIGAPPAEAASLTSWNWPVVVDGLRAAAPRLNWAKVAMCLDSERCALPDQAAFALLAAAYRRGAGEQLPVEALTGGMWKHPACQLALLRLAAAAPPEVFSFQSSKRLVAPLEGMPPIPQLTPNYAWASVDLVQAMCGLYESGGLVQPARDALQYPVAACPDLLLVAVSETRTSWNMLMRDVYVALLPQHLVAPRAGSGVKPYSRELLARVWAASPLELMLDLLWEVCQQDVSQLPRVVEVCSDIGALPQVRVRGRGALAAAPAAAPVLACALPPACSHWKACVSPVVCQHVHGGVGNLLFCWGGGRRGGGPAARHCPSEGPLPAPLPVRCQGPP